MGQGIFAHCSERHYANLGGKAVHCADSHLNCAPSWPLDLVHVVICRFDAHVQQFQNATFVGVIAQGDTSFRSELNRAHSALRNHS
jgi:hypothetical protein